MQNWQRNNMRHDLLLGLNMEINRLSLIVDNDASSKNDVINHNKSNENMIKSKLVWHFERC